MTATPTHTSAPHWTPRQREVLDLLARGCTNPQIAERLGISLDGAKWHVSEVITRLGVDTREEAADYWRAENGLRRRLFRMARAAWPGALWGRVAFASLTVAAIGAGAALAILSLRDDNPVQADATPPATTATSPQATVVASTSASPSASPTPDVIDGVSARPLTLGEPVQLPSGILLQYAVAGYATDSGGGGGAHLVFRAGSGQLVDTPPPRPPAQLGTLYSGLGDVLSPVIYAAVCTQGTCISLTYPSGDAQDQVYRSIDGGATWLLDGNLPRGAYFTAFTSDGQPVILSRPGGDGTRVQFSIYPSGPILKAPAPAAYFTNLSDGTPAWIDQDSGNWYSEDGTRLIWDNRGSALDGTTLVASSPGSLYVTWQGTVGRAYVDSPYSIYLGVADPAGKLTDLFSWPGNIDMNANAFVAPHTLLGNVSLDAAGRLTADSPPARFEPALFDLNSGTIHPIPELSAGLAGFADGKNEHAFVSRVILGNFARVATGSDCLNLRESPSTTARSLACLHDGVLVRLRDEPSPTIDGTEWLSVDAPGAQRGWVSAEFVER